MSTLVQSRPKKGAVVPVVRYDVEPDDIEEIEDMSPELYEELEQEFNEVGEQLARGELRPMTTTEIAAAVGFKWPK